MSEVKYRKYETLDESLSVLLLLQGFRAACPARDHRA